jgi:hypothetical protein
MAACTVVRAMYSALRIEIAKASQRRYRIVYNEKLGVSYDR